MSRLSPDMTLEEIERAMKDMPYEEGRRWWGEREDAYWRNFHAEGAARQREQNA
jgi:hypothetical protein